MTFEKTLKDVEDCLCLENTLVNNEDNFARRIYKNAVEEEDFNSYHEIGKTAQNNCNSKCGHRGVSVNICADDTKKTELIDTYKKTVVAAKKINPDVNIPEYCLVFKFKDEAGKMKQTGKNETHFDFYKSDAFNVNDHLTNIEIVSLV